MVEAVKCFNGDVKIRFRKFSVHLSSREARILKNQLNKLLKKKRCK